MERLPVLARPRRGAGTVLLAALLYALVAGPHRACTAPVAGGTGTHHDASRTRAARLALERRVPAVVARGAGLAAAAAARPDAPRQYASLAAAVAAARYAVHPAAADPQARNPVAAFATNPAQGFGTCFSPQGIRVVAGRAAAVPWVMALRLRAIGAGETLTSVPPATPLAASARPDCNRVEYRRGDVIEWYENRPEGLEQGFTLVTRPHAAPTGAPVRIALAVDGDLTPVAASPGPGEAPEIRLVTSRGKTALGYKGLHAWDAAGVALPAWMTVQGREVALLVDDAQAVYPVTIDPLLYAETKIVPDGISEGQSDDRFGVSVCVSGDTALVGASGDTTPAGGAAGSAYVFVRSGSAWTQQAHLLAGDAAAGARFGQSVSLSGDTAVIGADGAVVAGGSFAGAAYVFVRSGSTWTQQAKLTASDTAAFDQFGLAVSVSGDTAVVGACYDDTLAGSDAGSVYVFLRSGTTWTQQAQLTASDAAAGDLFGQSVSASGETAVVGACYDDTAGSDAGSVYVFLRSDGTWSQQAQLTASDAAAGDAFGQSVSVDADTVVVGAEGDDAGVAGDAAGSAYVFTRSESTWTQQAKLTAGDATGYDRFGHAIAVSGDTVVVGADGDDVSGAGDAGSAYVFLRSGSTWTQQAKLTADAPGASDSFGCSVSVSGDTALVGAYHDDTAAGRDAGSATVFTRSDGTWSQQAQLVLDSVGAARDDYFGYAVSVSGDTALVGAYYDDTSAGLEAGSAYVFTCSGSVWTQQAQLTASDGAGGDYFGGAVSVSGDTAVVGAYYDDTAAGTNAGSAYVFVRSGSTWTQQGKLTASDGSGNDYFGWSVSLSGDTAVVGAHYDNIGMVSNAGSAYVFVRSGSTWTQQAKLTASDGAADDFLGWSVAVSGDTAVVGACYDDTAAGSNAGSAYVFLRSGTAWSQQAQLTASDAASGDYFGYSVAVSGDTALVGAYSDDTAAGVDAGSAYVFARHGSTWTQQAHLMASAAASGDQFGGAVAVAADRALVGALGDDRAAGSNVGSAFIFTCNGSTWTEEGQLTASDGAAGDEFGRSLALSGDTAVVGACYGDTAAGSGAGAAYVYQLCGSLDHFDVEAAGGGDIGLPAALLPYSIQVKAKDADGRTVQSFTGTVEITSTGTLAAGGGTTAPFVNGILASHSVTFASAGTGLTLSATQTGGSVTGTSNLFDVTGPLAVPGTPAGDATATDTILWT